MAAKKKRKEEMFVVSPHLILEKTFLRGWSRENSVFGYLAFDKNGRKKMESFNKEKFIQNFANSREKRKKKIVLHRCGKVKGSHCIKRKILQISL